MKKPENWDNTEAFTGDFKHLEPGGYVCKILGAKSELTKSGKESLAIMFDIVEGEFKNFYTDQFNKKQSSNSEAKWPNAGTYRQLTEGDSLPFFKGMITAIEKSNSGYHWNFDESTLRGKLFGGVFGQEEYEDNNGNIKLSTKIRFIRSVEQVKSGIETPDIKRLKKQSYANANQFGTDIHGSSIPEEEIPWG